MESTAALQTLIRPELLTLTEQQIHALTPYTWVFAGTVIAIFFAVMKKLSPKWPVFAITVATCLAGIWASWSLIPQDSLKLFNDMMISDAYSNTFNVIFLVCALFTILASMRYLDREKLQHPEYYLLVLFGAMGMMYLTSALDLIVLFIALELMSLAVYALVGFRRADRRSNEAAMKYFILGSAASGVLLYGTALLYGATGSTQIHQILAALKANPALDTPLFTLGAWLVSLGFLFKVAAVPFHMWMPDVYEGAPAPVTGFMTTGLKAAAFGAFLRVFISLGYGTGLTEAVQHHIHQILWVIAALTMVVGNIIALTQTNLKRMLAYSSIAHSGYLIVGILAGPASEQGYAPLVVYLISYAAMNMGAFVVLSILSTQDDGGLNLHDLSGLSQRRPWLAFALSVFLLSMAGIPPTAGFAAKYLLFYSAVQAGEIPLVVISVLCSAISVYYYLRVLVYMYMREPAETRAAQRTSFWSAITVAAMVVVTLQFGILPERMIAAAKKAVSSLVS